MSEPSFHQTSSNESATLLVSHHAAGEFDAATPEAMLQDTSDVAVAHTQDSLVASTEELPEKTEDNNFPATSCEQVPMGTSSATGNVAATFSTSGDNQSLPAASVTMSISTCTIQLSNPAGNTGNTPSYAVTTGNISAPVNATTPKTEGNVLWNYNTNNWR